jgi:hypothetical protein
MRRFLPVMGKGVGVRDMGFLSILLGRLSGSIQVHCP